MWFKRVQEAFSRFGKSSVETAKAFDDLFNCFKGDDKKMFDFEKYKGHYVMHCKTEEEAKDFCRVMHEDGRCWSDGESYANITAWSEYKEHTAYYFNEGKFGDIKNVNSAYHRYLGFDADYRILEWSDFMKKKVFTTTDLKTWDIILRENGEVAIVLPYDGSNHTILFSGGATLVLEHFYDDDFTHSISTGPNIIAVRRVANICDLCYDAFDKKLGRLVWEREEPVEEMTMDDVCKALGKRVKIVDKK